MKKSRKRIGIVRGVVPRLTQAEYASSFSQLKPVFISSKGDQELKEYINKKKLEWRELELENVYGFDPVKWVKGKQTHQSWVRLKNFREAAKDLEVLEVHELYFFDSGQAVEVAKEMGILVIAEVWTSMSEHLAYKLPPYSWTAKKVIKSADLLVARSKRAEKSLLKLGADEKKITTIYYGVNLERFYPRKTKRKGKELRVLFVGRLDKFKGVDLLLNIWEEVMKKESRARLWLVGQGKFFKKAKKTKGVKVFGQIEYLKLPEIYRQADVFVSPTQDIYLGPFKWAEEYFSHTLMEAQACGLPIVATRCGGIREEVGGNNWLVHQNNKEQLLEALVDCLGDEEQRQAAGRKNRERAEKQYDLSKQVRKLEEEIMKL
jgi:glycosyltransferase involved in cell wall biosynthesis